MRGDGDGWVHCARGHRHWGRFGAAGLLVRAPTDRGERAVLLQLRAPWSHHGDTWGLPGGARDSGESPQAAALREVAEETTLDPNAVVLSATFLDDHGGWSYTTVLADAAGALDVQPTSAETTALRWVALGAVVGLDLHPGLTDVWPALVELAADTPERRGRDPKSGPPVNQREETTSW